MRQSNDSVKAIEGLESRRLWNHFLEISRIPRESGNEEGMRRYLISFAKDHGFESEVDTTGNLIMRVPATEKMERVPSLALQGHMDMVCVKDEGIEHNFATDPLILRRDGDWLSAEGTTLGADNGIAIAMILDLLGDPDAAHGPIEAIFTVSEETGMEGAFGLDGSRIKSRNMLNLDSEEEGVFYIGCAGGVEVNGTILVEPQPVFDTDTCWDVKIDGLLGGHSGGEIHKQRANAISCMARFLHEVNTEGTLKVVSINGGTKRNVIPSVCKATLTMPSELDGHVINTAKLILQAIKNEFHYADPGIGISVSKSKQRARLASSPAQSRALVNALFLAPHGVDRMSHAIENLVETSSNLAVVKTFKDRYELVSSHRSSILSSRDHVANKTIAAFETAKASCKLENPYPSWTPNPDSPLAELCSKAWEEQMGRSARITAIHAGLECGIINSLVEGMDSVSLGPDLRGVHATSEKVSISSTLHIAAFLRHLCTIIE